MTDTSTPRPLSYVLTTRLDAEWRRLRTHPDAIRTVRSWSGPTDALSELFGTVVDLHQVLVATHAGRSEPSGDEVLAALVALADEHHLAGRILVQRLFPGVVPGAMRHRWNAGGDDPIELAIGALWLAIRAFDPTRRTRHIAPMIVSDAIHLAFRKQQRRRSSAERAMAPHLFVAMPAESRHEPLVEFAEVVADARRAGVSDDDLDLLRDLVQLDSTMLVASERNVTARTIRNHRQRAVQRVREAVAVGA